MLRLVSDTPGITFAALAQRTKFERSATSRILSRLIKAGLVHRENSKEDARQFALTITQKGLDLCAVADPLSLEMERLMLAPFSPAEQETFILMIDRMLEWIHGGFGEAVAEAFPDAVAPSGETARKAD